MRRAALVLLAAAALTGCGETDDRADAFCTLAAALDRSNQEIFGQLGMRRASDVQFRRAHRRFLRENEATLGRIRDEAPAAIQGDVTILIRSFRAAAGRGRPVNPALAESSARRVERLQRSRCT